MKFNVKADHHTHSHFSDGAVSIEEMALAAKEAGLNEITFTDHMPLPFKTRYAMDRGRLNEYRRTIRNTRTQYENKMIVGMGMEIEFIPEFREWIHEIVSLGWDRLLVSIHSIMFDGIPYLVNGTREEFDALLGRFDRDPEALCRHYYTTLQAAYRTGWFDVAGHLDVIKKWAAPEKLIDESAPWYRQLIDETLSVIKDQNMTLEINTGGLTHAARSPYPGEWIVRQALAREIPLHLGSDAHNPSALGQYFEDAAVLNGV